MNESLSDSWSELRLSPKPVLAALLCLGGLLVLGAEVLPAAAHLRQSTILLFLALAAQVIGGWILVDRWPVARRWFTVVALVTSAHLAGLLLDVPGSLAWAAVPTAFALPLAGPTAVTLVAAGESALVLLIAAWPPAGRAGSEAAAALVVVWAVFGAIAVSNASVCRHTAWLEEYFKRARHDLDEDRNRRSELLQALEGLASANRQLALANERIGALRALAEEARRVKTTFVANVSHEFRTPLNMIFGLVDLMVENPEIYDIVLSPKMRTDLDVVRRNCQHLSDMINDVLDLTRMEAGCLTLHRERVELSEIIESSATVVSPLMQKKQLALQIVVPHDLPAVYCDRTRILQVVLNLLSNAARFTDEGGITIEVTQENHHVLVRVTDTGPGVSPEDAERIFEPFGQGTGQLWRSQGGSGLGLSISQQFVKLHGGRMWIESELGVGTSFFFTLPISPPSVLTWVRQLCSGN